MLDNIIPYDLEVYPNIFTATFYLGSYDKYLQFECSWRKNHMGYMLQWLEYWESAGYEMSGYNNLGYDYPIIHAIMEDDNFRDYRSIYSLGKRIIETPYDDRYSNRIPPWKVRIKQHDLMVMMAHDKIGSMVSLKELEFKMRMDNIEDLPFEPGKPIPQTDEAAETLLHYNKHDVNATRIFTNECKDAMVLRSDMSKTYKKDFSNHTEASMAKAVMVSELEKRGVQCYDNRQPRQTIRENIMLKNVVFPYISFETPAFNNVLQVVNGTTVEGTKGSFSHDFEVDEVEYRLALGGIHGSVRNKTFKAGNGMVITDADVTSYYPQLGIVNRISPAHLPTDVFCETVKTLFDRRQTFSKKTHPIQNKALKIVINAIYGMTNDKHSPLMDSLYTMTITVNGQLLLLMLAERLMKYVPGLKIIQCNTDGVTAIYPERHQDRYKAVCDWWQQLTLLNLEFEPYSLMAVRDVNNYIAVSTSGGIKRKSAYNHEKLEWNKDHSSLVIKKAAEKAILEGYPVRKFIHEHDNPYDFMEFVRVNKSTTLYEYGPVKIDDQVVFDSVPLREIQRATRFYVSNSGIKLMKNMPPLRRKTMKVKMVYPGWTSKKVDGCNKNLTVENVHEYNRAVAAGYKCADGGTYDIGPVREMGIKKEWLCTVANKINDGENFDFNYEYYITEAEKLVEGVKGL